MKEFFLESGKIESGKIGGIPVYTEDKQSMVNETDINQAFDPANDAFDAIRELGDWIFDFFSNLLSGAFGNLM